MEGPARIGPLLRRVAVVVLLGSALLALAAPSQSMTSGALSAKRSTGVTCAATPNPVAVGAPWGVALTYPLATDSGQSFYAILVSGPAGYSQYAYLNIGNTNSVTLSEPAVSAVGTYAITVEERVHGRIKVFATCSLTAA